MPGFVDVHAHVVPSGDDGAESIEEGLALCRLAHEAGTEILFATPHAHAPWDHYPRTPERDAPLRRLARRDARRGRRLGARPAARLGGVPDRDRRERSGRARARGDACGADRVPGIMARPRGSGRDRHRGGRRGRGGRARAGARPSRAVPPGCGRARRASGRSPSAAGFSASTLPRSSAATAPPPSARPGRCSTPASSRWPHPTPTRTARPPVLDDAYRGGSRAPGRRGRAATVRRQRASLGLAARAASPPARGRRPSSSAFAREKCRQPKKPLLAEYGDGCAAVSTWWRVVSTIAPFCCA